ncbi:hypothetical protein GGR21_002112 [Dysgonomonas hofstadii]|uniref:DUF4349 domain-containing protein n=1 Tax=Dysgonomonas hofstadii TaxID=637886 RepID=A0A840CM74_9BACT|nr:DUF4349 domain-containing protein [Dysgonomonas hofstadii]MBB4036211.1 hypothetical protein [Dysgonomonas hofstadii]
MKTTNNYFIALTIGLFIVLLSCSGKGNMGPMDEAYTMMDIPEDGVNKADQALDEMYEYSPNATDKQSAAVKFVPPVIVPNFIASQAAIPAYDDGVHKFIRTAGMKFKVNDVVSSTHIIENIILKNNGFIIKSDITNQNMISQTINISKDSALIWQEYNLSANLELRVPYQLLDSTLRQIAPLAVVIDYRTIEASDVTTQLMAERLKQQRLAKKQQRVSTAINTRSGKLDDVIAAEESLDYAMEAADNAKVKEFSVNDKINYSAITINLYQNKISYSEEVVRQQEFVDEYTPGFGNRAIEGLKTGWDIINSLIVFLITIWPLLLITGIGVFIYIRYIRKK